MAGRLAGRKSRDRLRTAPGGGAARAPYPDFDVAADDKWSHDWDAKTRHLIADRVMHVPAYRFLAPAEARLLEVICDRLLPQDDRPAAERVPIAPWIDDRLARDDGDGYRYEDMPADPDAVRRGLRALERVSTADHGRSFVDLDPAIQAVILRDAAEGRGAPAWDGLPARRWFQLVLNQAISFYYAHPSAWSEIGFNGPASPRGHMRLDLGRRDPWEAIERRPRSSAPIVRRHRGTGGGESGEATH